MIQKPSWPRNAQSLHYSHEIQQAKGVYLGNEKPTGRDPRDRQATRLKPQSIKRTWPRHYRVQSTRTTTQGGGAWEIGVESHFGNWDEKLHYKRPLDPEGRPGYGCSLCTPSEAFQINYMSLEALFRRHGIESKGRLEIGSKAKLAEALKAEAPRPRRPLSKISLII